MCSNDSDLIDFSSPNSKEGDPTVLFCGENEKEALNMSVEIDKDILCASFNERTMNVSRSLVNFKSPSNMDYATIKEKCLILGTSDQDNSAAVSYTINEADLAFCEATNFNFSGFMNDFDGKESLGLLHPSYLNNLNEQEGRESLGILHMNFDINVDNMPSIEITDSSGLETNRNDILFSLNNKTTSSLMSFHSDSLECSEPSKIYSLYASKLSSLDIGSTQNIFNIAFNSSEYERQLMLSLSSLRVLCQKDDWRGRIGSLPGPVTQELKDLPAADVPNRKVKSLNIEIGEIPEDYKEDVFSDSVFIEANYLASKIADGTILEDDNLDSTREPSLMDLEEDEKIKCNTEDVFKTVDKMLPAAKLQFSNCDSNEISVKSSGSINTNNSKSKDARDILQNLSAILNDECKNLEKKTEGQNLLSSLANIISQSCTLSSKNQASIEDSGHSPIGEKFEVDQNENGPESYEVLDLRTNTNISDDNYQALDLSMQSKASAAKRLSQSFSHPNKVHPNNVKIRSYSVHSSISSLEASENKSVQSNVTASSNDSNLSNLSKNSGVLKVKSKRVGDKSGSSKAGPLKAIIPIGNMARRNSFKKCGSIPVPSTPPNISEKPGIFKSKRTSTPINEPKLKPMAQSTPDGGQPLERSRPGSCSTQLKRKKFECPVSPLTRPNSFQMQSPNSVLNKSELSGPAPNNVSDMPARRQQSVSSIPSPKQGLNRRKSVSDLQSRNTQSGLKRSNSIGKDGGIMSVLGRVRENLANTSKIPLELNKSLSASDSDLKVKNTNVGLSENKIKARPFNLLSKLKRSAPGKENTFY